MTALKFMQAMRLISLLEGLSWLALIGAMIYRSQTGHHEPVAFMGSIHGGLFCLFALTLILVWQKAQWTMRFAFLIGLSSLIPFGFLCADSLLRKKLSTVIR